MNLHLVSHFCGSVLALIFAVTMALAQPAAEAESSAQRLVEAARKQVGVTTSYDPAYVGLKYPGGDVPVDRGVCTDVVVRAFRQIGLDLQQAVHMDMKANFARYPDKWGLKRPDTNIDHRRVPNLRTYFQRSDNFQSLNASQQVEAYEVGDLVTWMLPGNRPHIGFVSDRQAANGHPLILHNMGRGAVEEDVLFLFPITGHYRFQP